MFAAGGTPPAEGTVEQALALGARPPVVLHAGAASQPEHHGVGETATRVMDIAGRAPPAEGCEEQTLTLAAGMPVGLHLSARRTVEQHLETPADTSGHGPCQ